MSMNKRTWEKILVILYTAGAWLSLVTTICVAVPWNHWEEILNTCLSANCGCILYGTQMFHTFTGGDISLCFFTTLAPVPAFIIAAVWAGYHGYRVCMYDDGSDNTMVRMSRRNGAVAVVTPRTKRAAPDTGCVCWTAAVVLTCVTAVLLICSTATLTVGYYKTCGEYRKGLSHQVSGDMAAALSGRLSCGAILDFMDYVEPMSRPFQRKDYKNYNRPHEEHDYRREGYINTGLSLQIALGCAIVNCHVWVVLFLINGMMMYHARGWCCSS